MKFGTTRSSFTKTVTQDTLSQFSWRDVFEEIKLRLPLLHSALCGVVTSRVNENVKLNM